MVIKGEHRIKYTLDRKQEELVVKVEIKEREGLIPQFKSVYYGVATVNGEIYNEDINGCVNAQYCAEGIALEVMEEYKEKAKSENKSLRIKRK